MARAVAIALLWAGLAPVACADALPASKQALLLLRVLAYDRNLRARAANEATVVITYRDGDDASLAERDAVVAALQDAARSFVVSGLPVRVKHVPWRGAEDLDARLASLRAAALYVVGSLASEAPAISVASRARSALTFAPSREMVSAGLAVGFVQRGDRAALMVNVAAARAEGADLDSAFLAIAEVTGRR
jgi:hypothetical protein